MLRLVVPADIWGELDSHFRRHAPSEEGAFVLVRAGTGARSKRFVAHELLLPQDSSAWESRGRHELRPSGRWLSAAIGAAVETRSGLIFVHSHPDPGHPPMLSPIDQTTSLLLSQSIVPTLDESFLSLVWADGALAGWVFEAEDPGKPRLLTRTEVVGGGRRRILRAGGSGLTPGFDPEDDRQRRALGAEGNLDLRELSLALVGAGGTGSPLAEQVVRMGVARLTLVDPDVVDHPSNLRRVAGSSAKDVTLRSAKVGIAERHLRSLELGTEVRGIQADVRRPEVLQELLDADVVLSTTDTHSSRAFLNQVAYQYWLPVIDIGTVVGTSPQGVISGMPVEVRVLLPDTGCLHCRGTIDPHRLRAENLAPRDLEREIAEGYVQGLGHPVRSLAALNGFAASMAALTLLRLCTSGVDEPGFVIDGWELYVQVLGTQIDPACICSSWRGQAGLVPLATW